MPYEFTEFDYEPETQASSAHGGKPPSKLTATGVLDPPAPLLPTARVPRLLAAFLLGGIGAFVIFELCSLLLGR
jgi:hypothetical protein